jgi:hypothetical protein
VIVMTLLVRDEEDVIATNIAYHLARGVDHVIVTNNRSVDATRAIVEGFVASGRVSLLDEDGDDYSQHHWVTRMARMAAAMGADWVINADADEMFWPAHGDLASVLAAAPASAGALVAERTNFLPLHASGGNPFVRMRRRHVASVNGLGRPLGGKTMHRAAADVVVAPGNHDVASPSLGGQESTDAVVILHYPYRSRSQFARKVANGGAALERNVEYSPLVGDVWCALYEQQRAGTLDAWCDALPHADDPETSRLIACGEVVVDDRLARFLEERGIA